MNATRILPDLQCSLVCEEIRQEVNGNFFLIGVINFVRVPKLPVMALRLCVFNRWAAGVGQFTESVRLIAPDQMTVLRKAEVKFTLKDAALSATRNCTNHTRPDEAWAKAATPRGVSGSQAHGLDGGASTLGP